MSQAYNTYDEVPGKPAGGSNTGKILLGLGLGCGVLLLVCCGGVGLFIAMVARSMQPITDGPGVVAVADKITKIDVPPALKPVFAMDGTIPMAGQTVRMVLFEDSTNDSSLMMIDLSGAMDRNQLESQMRSQRGGRQEDVRISGDSESHTVTINGAEADFRVSKAVGQDSKEEYWYGEGTFDGKNGAVLLEMQLRSPDYTKEDVIKILDSMK